MWTEPEVIEKAIGLEINSYALCAIRDDDETADDDSNGDDDTVDKDDNDNSSDDADSTESD